MRLTMRCLFGCLRGVTDWNADGLDGVAVWCKEVTQNGKVEVYHGKALLFLS
jgi:hypothetical protein